MDKSMSRGHNLYRSHEFHPKAGQSYLSLGDPYVKKSVKMDRATGKQMQTQPSRTGKIKGCFSTTDYKKEPFVDSNLYIEKFPIDSRKKGFGSKDVSRRDEFTLHIRTEQYRELLKGEEKHQVNPLEGLEEEEEEKFSGMRTSSADYGWGCHEVAAPEFGVSSEIKTFFDRSHL